MKKTAPVIRTYALTRIPSHSELQRAYARLPRPTKAAVGVQTLRDHHFDLKAALDSDDPDTLTAPQRKAAAQLMHERGAAFMLSAPPERAPG